MSSSPPRVPWDTAKTRDIQLGSDIKIAWSLVAAEQTAKHGQIEDLEGRFKYNFSEVRRINEEIRQQERKKILQGEQ